MVRHRLAATLAKAAPEVVLCVSNVATRDAQELARAFHIVALSGDLVPGGFVCSLAHPGGNITGVGQQIKL